jgi:hypothetical protein
MKTKNWMAVFLLVIILGNIQSTLAQDSTRVDYQQKSKKQKTAAWVMLGGGIVLVSIGIVQAASNDVYDLANGVSTAFGGQNVFDDGPNGTALMVIGGAAALGSIPIFISASENAQKAARIRAQDFSKSSSKQNRKSSFLTRKSHSKRISFLNHHPNGQFVASK